MLTTGRHIVDSAPLAVKSAARTVEILELLAASPERLTLAELQARTGYPRSSLHTLLRTLRDLKWIETSEGGSAYGVGPHALVCGTAYLDRDPAIPFAERALEKLRADTGWTTHFARIDGSDIIYLASREVADRRRRSSRVGRCLPAHVTALGQALLAELTWSEVDALLPKPLSHLTPDTITSRPALRKELARVTADGYAEEHEQGTPGIACVASAVSYRIPATDAISVSIPVQRATPPEVTRVREAVIRQASALAEALRRQGIR
jgi:IclR family transcriptional regulator, acetate operon repressor